VRTTQVQVVDAGTVRMPDDLSLDVRNAIEEMAIKRRSRLEPELLDFVQELVSVSEFSPAARLGRPCVQVLDYRCGKPDDELAGTIRLARVMALSGGCRLLCRWDAHVSDRCSSNPR
jgi:hypothetical protein